MFHRLRSVLRRDKSLSEIRHTLIARIGKRETFLSESSNRGVSAGSVPVEYREFVSRIPLSPSSTWQSAIALVADLTQRRQLGDGLSRDSVTALRLISSKKGGICSDISQVFTGLCIAAGIEVREWGVELDFGTKEGHSFNEVFASEHGKWVFLDAFKSLYARARGSQTPLGVAELIDLVSAGQQDQIELIYFGPEDKRRESMVNVSVYYLNPTNVFFLLSNNNVFKQDLLLKRADVVPLALLHAMMFVVGIYPRFEVYTNEKTRAHLTERLQTHKRGLASMFGRLARAVTRA